jgi:3-oxoacyl-[acyl-carrier protein] reductase
MRTQGENMEQHRRTAVVTGAGRGIGQAIAERLARDGMHVVLADAREGAAEQAAADLAAQQLSAVGVTLDIRDRDAVATMLDTLPRLDVLVNNAAVFTDRDFFDLTEDDFRTMYDVNVVGLFVAAQEGAKRMTEGARIINIGSRSYLGGRNHAHYIASKAAVAGLTRSMAIDLAPRGIYVNAVAPGVIETAMFQTVSAERRVELAKLQLDGKFGKPSSIANAVAFFAAEATDFITGQILMVDGGKSLGGSKA